MSFGLWDTLLRPDQEEKQNPDRTEVGRAANYLQVGEFQFLQLAYHEWHNKDLPEDIIGRLFHDYMIHNEVPHWARHFARQVNRLADQGRVDENDPRYHRYDHDYVTHVPQGTAKFLLAAGGLCLFLFGSIWAADRVAVNSVSMLPPYFNSDNLPPIRDGFGRADSVQPRTGP